MLEPRTTINCPTDKPLVRVKVVPASFGLEGFEDAVWEATEDLMKHNFNEEGKPLSSTEGSCEAITFIVAAPDLFTDHINGGWITSGRVRTGAVSELFSSSLKEKLVIFSKEEGVPLDDTIRLASFHPLWKIDEGSDNGIGSGVVLNGRTATKPFPYTLSGSFQKDTTRDQRDALRMHSQHY